jgi:hypothetical protein
MRPWPLWNMAAEAPATPEDAATAILSPQEQIHPHLQAFAAQPRCTTSAWEAAAPRSSLMGHPPDRDRGELTEEHRRGHRARARMGK